MILFFLSDLCRLLLDILPTVADCCCCCCPTCALLPGAFGYSSRTDCADSFSFYSCASLIGKQPATLPRQRLMVTGSDNTHTRAASFFCGCVSVCLPLFSRPPPPARRDGLCAFRVIRGVCGPAGMLCGREGCSRETRVLNKVAPRVFSLTCPLVCSAGRGGSAARVSSANAAVPRLFWT